VTDAGQIVFYFGIANPSAEQIAAAYERLGILPGDLFPLTYRPDVSLPEGPLGGELLGFYYMEGRGDDEKIGYSR
jgi:hypothetical protein